MNAIFVLKNGTVETTDSVDYWNRVRQDAQDYQDELTANGEFDREAAESYINGQWRQEATAFNYETGETEQADIPDDLWTEYVNDLLNQINKNLQ